MIDTKRGGAGKVRFRWGEPCPRGGRYALLGPTGRPTGRVVMLRLRDRFPKPPAPGYAYVLLPPPPAIAPKRRRERSANS